ncbi:MAG TPA: SGNH/GDSL hydrolase family protein [Streptosporangiaceae bacterium]
MPGTRAEGWLKNAPWKRFVVLGDGHARGPSASIPRYGNLSWSRWVADQLKRQQAELLYLNLARRDALIPRVRATQLQHALTFRPDLAAVMCGGADPMRDSFCADAVETELTRIIVALRDIQCDVVIVGLLDFTRSGRIAPDLRGPLLERLRQLTERMEAVALRFGALHVDIAAHPAAPDPAMLGADGRQLNRRGHAVVAGEVARRLGRHLGNEVD